MVQKSRCERFVTKIAYSSSWIRLIKRTLNELSRGALPPSRHFIRQPILHFNLLWLAESVCWLERWIYTWFERLIRSGNVTQASGERLTLRLDVLLRKRWAGKTAVDIFMLMSSLCILCLCPCLSLLRRTCIKRFSIKRSSLKRSLAKVWPVLSGRLYL